MSFLVFQKGYFVLHHYSISMVKNHQHFELILLLSICQLIWNMLLSKNILIELSCTARFPIENWLLLPLSLCWCWIFFLSLGIIWCTWMLSSSGIFLFAFFLLFNLKELFYMNELLYLNFRYFHRSILILMKVVDRYCRFCWLLLACISQRYFKWNIL